MRFSLRSLFRILTLVAVVIGTAVHAPVALFFAFVFVSPLLFVALMATLSRR
jgi:hypothetical protein